MPQFDIATYPSQLFWLFANFTILYFIVRWYVAPQIGKILSSRKNLIDSDIAEAKRLAEQAQSLKNIRSSELEAIELEAQELKDKMLAELEAAFAIKKAKVAGELDLLSSKASEDIAKAISEYKVGEKEAATSLADFIIKRITGRRADEALLTVATDKYYR